MEWCIILKRNSKIILKSARQARCDVHAAGIVLLVLNSCFTRFAHALLRKRLDLQCFRQTGDLSGYTSLLTPENLSDSTDMLRHNGSASFAYTASISLSRCATHTHNSLHIFPRMKVESCHQVQLVRTEPRQTIPVSHRGICPRTQSVSTRNRRRSITLRKIRQQRDPPVSRGWSRGRA